MRKHFFSIFCILVIIFINEGFCSTFEMNLSNPSIFKFVSNAKPQSDCFQITDNSFDVKGAIWYEDMINIAEGFDMTFSFRLQNPRINSEGRPDSRNDGSDGFAFSIQPESNTAIGSVGGNMGYRGLYNAFVIEYDQYQNSNESSMDYRDPDGCHIGIQYAKNSTISPEHKSPYKLGPIAAVDIISDGREYFSRIVYDPTLKELSIYLNIDTNWTDPVIKISSFDIHDYVQLNDDKAYMGFTASCGKGSEDHHLLSWKVDPLKADVVYKECDSSWFYYRNFEKIDNLKLVEKASNQDGLMYLTKSITYTKGAMYRDRLVAVKNGFETEFAFKLNNGYNSDYSDKTQPGADGITFVIFNSSTDQIGDFGGGIGYEGMKNCVAVEFDLYNNNSLQIFDYGDPNGNHIAVAQSKSVISSNHNVNNNLGICTDIPEIKTNNQLYYSRIVYNSTNKTLEIYLEENQTFTSPRLVISNFDLSNSIDLDNGKRAYIGFTSATGNSRQEHIISSWYFCPISVDGIADIEDVSKSKFTISPNPAENIAFINYTSNCEKSTIKVYDVLGNIVTIIENINNLSNVNSVQINTSQYPKGIYYIEVSDNISVYSEKLIIK